MNFATLQLFLPALAQDRFAFVRRAVRYRFSDCSVHHRQYATCLRAHARRRFRCVFQCVTHQHKTYTLRRTLRLADLLWLRGAVHEPNISLPLRALLLPRLLSRQSSTTPQATLIVTA